MSRMGGRSFRNFRSGVVDLATNNRPLPGTNPAYSPGGPSGSNPDHYLDELERRLVGEGKTQQDAADRQFGRKQRVSDLVGQFAEEGPAAIAKQGDSAAGGLEALGDGLRDRGQEFASDLTAQLDALGGKVDRDVNAVMGAADRIERGVDKGVGAQVARSNAFADSAVKSSEEAAAGYQKDQSALVQATVAGIDQRVKNTMRMVTAGIRPDGTRMSPAEQSAAMREAQVQTAAETGQVTAQIQSQANETMASLRNTLAQVKLGASDAAVKAGALIVEGAQVKAQANQQRLGAAGLRAEAGTAIAQTKIQAEQTALQYSRMDADLKQMGAQIRSAATLDAANLRLQGLGQWADLIERNPETVVSLFSGLAAIYGARLQASGSTQNGINLNGPTQNWAGQFSQLGGANTQQARSSPTQATNRFRTPPPVGSGPFGSVASMLSGLASVPPGLA